MPDLSELKDTYDKMVNNLENIPEKRKTRNEQPTYTSPGIPNVAKGQTTKKVADANKSTANALKQTAKNTPNISQSQKGGTPQTQPQITGISISQLQSLIDNAINPIVGSIEKLTESHEDLRSTISSQGRAITALKLRIDENSAGIAENSEKITSTENRVTEAANEVSDLITVNSALNQELDDIKQQLLDRSVILNGPLIHDFVTSICNKDLGNYTRYKGHSSLDFLAAKLKLPEIRTTAANNSLTSPLSQPVQLGQESNITNVDTGNIMPETNEMHSTAPITSDIGFESVKKLQTNRIAVTVTTRDDVHKLFQLSKKMNRQFYVTEQLTKRRQGIMYHIRNYLKDNPDLDVALYTRNGTPMAKHGRRPAVPLKTEDDASLFIEKLESIINSS